MCLPTDAFSSGLPFLLALPRSGNRRDLASPAKTINAIDLVDSEKGGKDVILNRAKKKLNEC